TKLREDGGIARLRLFLPPSRSLRGDWLARPGRQRAPSMPQASLSDVLIFEIRVLIVYSFR
ncbi:TPA: hypothetical protein ACGEFB_003581, partial [Klebsiella pneumoniae]